MLGAVEQDGSVSMWTKVATAGAVGAIVAGAGVAALATTGSLGGTRSSSPTPSSSSAPSYPRPHRGWGQGRGAGLGKLGRLEHAEWVTREGSSNVTHDAVKGTATSVSAGSITARAADGFTLTFAVNSNTSVVVRGRGTTSVSGVHTGDNVLVVGVKSGSTLNAERIVDTLQ
jgi:hypothetical protein